MSMPFTNGDPGPAAPPAPAPAAPPAPAYVNCPVCYKRFRRTTIEGHVNKCLNAAEKQKTPNKAAPKRPASSLPTAQTKKARLDPTIPTDKEPQPSTSMAIYVVEDGDDPVPLKAPVPAKTLSLQDLRTDIVNGLGEVQKAIIEAMRQAIRTSDDKAAMYWTVCAIDGAEDPASIARQLVRAACEDVDQNKKKRNGKGKGWQNNKQECLADPNALVEAVACLQGCQNIGMPESDILLGQCAMRLARAPKSREVYDTLREVRRSLSEALLPVPENLPNGHTELVNGNVNNTGKEPTEEATVIDLEDSITETEPTEVATEVEVETTNVMYTELMELEQCALVTNTEPFECGVCTEQIPAGEGVVLRECIHAFCRECLADVVRHSTDATITCPATDCLGTLQEREIRSLVSPEQFELWLARGLAAAESGSRNAFHCRTPDCRGWALCDADVRVFVCPVCNCHNCVPCEAIHEDDTCEGYQAKLKAVELTPRGEADKKTQALIEQLITKGSAMECPECGVIITKVTGCDWLQCAACKTEICWATRGRRWGLGGRGDISGGCRCMVKRKRCHPKCRNCH